MANAAAYADTAAGIYDPQAAAESTQAGSARDASLASLDSQDKQIDPYYKTAEDNLATATNDARAKTDFSYRSALDGNASGLENNDNARTTNDYLKSLSGLTTEQANKHSDIAASRTLAQNNYNSTLQAITQKYAGLKSGYVADMLNQDAQNAFTERMAQESAATQRQIAAIQAASYGSSNSSSGPSMARNAIGGYSFKDGNGKGITAAQYVAASGGNYQDLAKLLSQSNDKTDKAVAGMIAKGTSAAALAKKYPEIFGGL